LESGETNINVIQERFDRATLAINGLEAEFEEHDSELETGARESIGATVIKILQTYNIDLDVEDAIRERDKIKKQFCLALCLRINGGSRKTKNYDVLPRVIAEAATLATRRSHQSLSASIG
jgi:hypothetical protein